MFDIASTDGLVSFTEENRSNNQRVIRARFNQMIAANKFDALLKSRYPLLNPQAWPELGVVYFNDSEPGMTEQVEKLAGETAEEFPPPKQQYPPSVYII